MQMTETYFKTTSAFAMPATAIEASQTKNLTEKCAAHMLATVRCRLKVERGKESSAGRMDL